VKPYLRLLFLRTRRVFLGPTLGVPFLLPTAVFLGRIFSHPAHALTAGQAIDAFVFTALVAVLFTILAVANLTAFLVHDERRGGRARALRLATIDGTPPVAAHLCHSSLLAVAAVAVGLLAPAAYAVATGLPKHLCLLVCLAAASFATISGVVGLWIGYLVPRVVAIIALQLAALWLWLRFAMALGDAVQAERLPLGVLAWLLAAHVVTLVVLSPLWRRTSARLW
jgi:hypothetical protein